MAKQFTHVIEHVDDYLHDVLWQVDAAYVEEHCRKCPICEAALVEARKRFAALDTVPVSEAPEALIRNTVQTIASRESKERKKRTLWTWGLFGPVAAAALVILCFHVYFLTLKPSSFDLSVLGQNQLFADTTGALRVRFLDRATGMGLAGVPIRMELRDKKTSRSIELGRFDTDKQGTGTPRLQLPDWEPGEYELCVIARAGSFSSEELTQPIRLRRSWRLMVTSDKPVYQPGQQVRLRSLALRRPDLQPVAGKQTTFTVRDPAGNIIYKKSDLTSKYGICAGDFPLATEIAEGPYTVVCKVGDTESKLTVEVKKYVLPKFEVTVVFDQPYYQPGQKVRGKVQADYHFGKPVAGAEVQLKIEPADLMPTALKDAKLTTDADGSASFDFFVPQQLIGNEVHFNCTANVTDAENQRHSRTSSSLITTTPLRIEAIPEAGTLVAGLSNNVYLLVSYPDGSPAAQARVLVSDHGDELVANDLGVVSFAMLPAGHEVSFTVKASDAKGKAATRTFNFTPGSANQDFILRSNKGSYNGGETMVLTAIGGGAEPIFIDLIKDGQTMLTQTVDNSPGGTIAKIDLPPDLVGTLQLCAYRLDSTGIVNKKVRVVYVNPANQLHIAATLDKSEYRPGGKAKLNVVLTDKDGKPTPGALSLSAVDKAVFSVLPQRPGMEGTFYSLDQKLMQPVYSIYNWSPDLTSSKPNAARRELEQALFCRTVTTGPEKQMHTLNANTWQANQNKVLERKRSALENVGSAWMVFFAVVGIALTVQLCVYLHPLERWAEWVDKQQALADFDYSPRVHRYEGEMPPSDSRQANGGGGCVLSMAQFLVLGALAVLVCLGSIAVIGKNANSAFGFVGSSVGAAVSGGGWSPNQDTESTTKVMEMKAVSTPPKTEAPNVPPVEEKEPEAAPLRIRDFFPETLLWEPELITDDQGKYTLDIDLADSITTWKLAASAVTLDGRLGGTQQSLLVFQPFFVDLNLPVSLMRGDEVTVPAIVANYLKEGQRVSLELEAEPWFEVIDDAGMVRKLDLEANERREVRFRIKVKKAGMHTLTVKASGKAMSDGIKRQIEVVPDGLRRERVVNGTLLSPVDLTLNVPANAIENSSKLVLKVYPSNFSQIVEGLDNIFRMPSGCFEQTSSTTYPNILALDYLKRTGKTAPTVEAKARQFIRTGYQRLITFEVPGGGFDWFGRPPANRTLTAYGLMEFNDMARVLDVDPQMVERTRNWLMKQRNPNGSWSAERHMLNDGLAGAVQRGDQLDLVTTAYIGWAVFEGQTVDFDAMQTRSYLLRHSPEKIHEPYVLALVCNALLALDPNGGSVQPYLARLESLKRTAPDGKLVWWEQGAGQRTTFYGAGDSGNVETTALAVLAMLKSNSSVGSARGALSWIAQKKDGNGTWYSTQATVMALKALVAGSSRPLGQEQERRIELALGEGFKRTIVIPPEQAEVMQYIELSDRLVPGDNRLSISETTGSGAGYQVSFRHHVPSANSVENLDPLTIDMVYDRTELEVGAILKATATVVNQTRQEAPMVMVELPIPAGFVVVPDALNQLIKDGTIAKYQMTGRTVTIYLRGLAPNKPLKLAYEMKPTLPVKVTVPAARVYEYYDPSKRGQSATVQMTVKAR